MSDDVHVSTKATPGDYDAFETAKPDEPIFTVQGGDPFGPPTVQYWADLAREGARALVYGPKDIDQAERDKYEPSEAQRADADKLLRKATSAEHVSWEMRAYQRGDTKAPEVRARYNEEVALPDDGNDRVAVRKALITSVTHLQNAAGIATEVHEALVAMGGHEEAVTSLGLAVRLLQETSDAIEPRRGQERT